MSEQKEISRRNLLALGVSLPLAGLIAKPSQALASITQNQNRPAPVNKDLVQQFVGVAHGNFDKVKELLGNEPGLLNAVWDWGGGDFESAIGAAGHIGHREIALFLIDKGARTDLFVHTMLGHTEIVQAALKQNPGLVNVKGPHGISLKRHAEVGKEQSADLLQFIEKLLNDKA